MPRMRVGGVDLFFKDQGAGTPIVFIHGTGGDANVWDGYARWLVPGHRLIAYDRRGYHRSGRLPPADLRQHTHDAAALLHHLEVPQATVVGHSLGAVLAVDLALTRPEMVAALVLIEPPWLLRLRPDRALLRLLLTVQLLRLSGQHARAAKRFLTWVYTDARGVSTFDRVPGAGRAMTEDTGTIAAEINSGPRVRFTRAQLATIACPVTLVLGERSAPYMVKAVRVGVRAVPQAKLVVIPGVAHELHVTAGSTIARLVQRAAKQAT